ncbi:MAG: hypothetical protein ACOCRK_05890 [bacterium]
MKVIFICYNYLTLYKAMFLIKNRYKKYSCTIIYREIVAKAPVGINKICNVFIIKKSIGGIYHAMVSLFPRLRNFIEKAMIAKRTCEILKKEIKKDKDNILVVFKDNEMIEATIIKYFVKNTNNKRKVILVEEGIGLYNNSNKKEENRLVYKILYKLFGLSKYSLQNFSQGYHPFIDKIICGNPDLFREKKKRRNIPIEKEINVFNKTDCIYFIKKIVKISPAKISRYFSSKYVYVTQPLSKDGIIDKEQELVFEKDIINLFLNKDKLLIKKHPRDDKKYNSFIEKGAQIFDQNYSAVPFECLYFAMKNPIIITVHSSVYKNILDVNNNAPVILLYRLIVDYIEKNKTYKINQEIDKIEYDNQKNVFIPKTQSELLKWLDNQ